MKKIENLWRIFDYCSPTLYYRVCINISDSLRISISNSFENSVYNHIVTIIGDSIKAGSK